MKVNGANLHDGLELEMFCIYDTATDLPIAIWSEDDKQWQCARTGAHLPDYDHINPHEVIAGADEPT